MPKNILVVDGHALLRNSIKQILGSSGYHVIAEASNRIEAIEQFEANRPNLDLVLMDILRPQIEGIQALITIREMDHEIPIIMMGVSSEDIIIQAGANACLSKPFQMNDLLRLVVKAIGDP